MVHSTEMHDTLRYSCYIYLYYLLFIYLFPILLVCPRACKAFIIPLQQRVWQLFQCMSPVPGWFQLQSSLLRGQASWESPFSHPEATPSQLEREAKATVFGRSSCCSTQWIRQRRRRIFEVRRSCRPFEIRHRGQPRVPSGCDSGEEVKIKYFKN